MSLSISFLLWVAAEQKVGQEVNISLAFFHWVGIALLSSLI